MLDSKGLYTKLGVVLLLSTVVGCSSKVAEKNEYSGFLQDYSDLKPEKTATGQEVLRWVSPDFRVSNYRSAYFYPVVYYPAPHPNSRVSESTLEDIRIYTEQRLKSAVGSRLQLVNQPQPGGLIVKTAITAVSAETKDMRVYEILPVTAVIAGTMALTGKRSQNATLFIEAQLVDVSTNQTVLKVVRKGYGRSVPNSNARINSADVKGAIDAMVKDVTAFPQ